MKGDLIKDFHDLLIASTFDQQDFLISFLNIRFNYLASPFILLILIG
jgi:hypothetical protein